MTVARNGGIEWALDQIGKSSGGAVHEAIEILLAAESDVVEPALFKLVRSAGKDLEVAAMASRILVERDPSRDPSFLLEEFSPKGGEDSGLPDRAYGKVEKFMVGEHPFAAMLYQFGFARLRQVNPVQQYADMLSHRFSPVRGSAAIGLGDTADLSALTPLASALADRSASVRKHAADAVRRLRHVGAADRMPEHQVYEKLVDCLGDSKRDVRIAAARALGSLGMNSALKDYRAHLSIFSWRRRRDIEQVLRGDIPPLYKIWPGDETT